MPAFGGEDSSQEIWHLAAFMRRLPHLSPEELKRMQELAGEAGNQKGEDTGQRSGAGEPRPAKPHSHGTEAKPHRH